MVSGTTSCKDHGTTPSIGVSFTHCAIFTTNPLSATGHGWAASGILRVYQTIAKSSSRDSLEWALPELAGYAEEIIRATWEHQQPDGSLFNYLDVPDSFTDMSATAFMAACTYRLALVTDATAHIPAADKAFALVKNSIAADGRLMNVVNPYDFTNPYQGVSPEGQAMVLMLQAAYRDFQSFSKGIDTSLGNVVRFTSLSIQDPATDSLPVQRIRRCYRRGQRKHQHQTRISCAQVGISPLNAFFHSLRTLSQIELLFLFHSLNPYPLFINRLSYPIRIFSSFVLYSAPATATAIHLPFFRGQASTLSYPLTFVRTGGGTPIIFSESFTSPRSMQGFVTKSWL